MTLTKFLNPKNDVAFKKIFGTEKNKGILIRFINDILEFKGPNQIQTVKFLSPIQDPEIAAKKQSILDVLCKDGNDVTYIIEMQVASSKGFEKRAQYYAAKAYSRQLNKGDNRYHNLKEVIFIAIADYIMFPNKTGYKSDHIILDKGSYEHDLKDFYFTFIELPKFKKPKNVQLESNIEQWCRFFKYAEETTEEEFEKIIGSDLVIKSAYEAINQFNWTEKELIAYEQEVKRMRDNLAVLEAAIDKAEAKGKAEGKIEEKFEIAKKMLSKNKPIEEIIDFTGLTVDQIEGLKN